MRVPLRGKPRRLGEDTGPSGNRGVMAVLESLPDAMNDEKQRNTVNPKIRTLRGWCCGPAHSNWRLRIYRATSFAYLPPTEVVNWLYWALHPQNVTLRRSFPWLLRDEVPSAAFEGVTAVIYLAHSWNSDVEHRAFSANINLSDVEKLARAAFAAGVPRFVLASTTSARRQALNAYGKIKFAIEELLLALPAATGRVSSARIGLVYGGPDRGQYGLLLKLLRLTPVLPMVDLTRNVQPIYFDEVVAGLLALATRPAPRATKFLSELIFGRTRPDHIRQLVANPTPITHRQGAGSSSNTSVDGAFGLRSHASGAVCSNDWPRTYSGTGRHITDGKCERSGCPWHRDHTADKAACGTANRAHANDCRSKSHAFICIGGTHSAEGSDRLIGSCLRSPRRAATPVTATRNELFRIAGSV
jgi:hypothetical protein